jgi:hypothetical protein
MCVHVMPSSVEVKVIGNQGHWKSRLLEIKVIGGQSQCRSRSDSRGQFVHPVV